MHYSFRRKAFDRNMTQNVLYHVSMDNPQLAAYIQSIYMRPTTRQEPLNASQTAEEQYVANVLQGKRDGVYFEYISRVRFFYLLYFFFSTIFAVRALMFFSFSYMRRHCATRVLIKLMKMHYSRAEKTNGSTASPRIFSSMLFFFFFSFFPL